MAVARAIYCRRLGVRTSEHHPPAAAGAETQGLHGRRNITDRTRDDHATVLWRLVRAIALWQFVQVIVEIPQVATVLSQIAANNQPYLTFYVVGPLLRTMISGVLFFSADWLAGGFTPSRSD